MKPLGLARFALLPLGLFGARAIAQNLPNNPSAIVINGTVAVIPPRIVEFGAGPTLYRNRVTVNGAIDLATQRLPPGCVGVVQREPHMIVRFRRGARHLRVYATSASDLTVVVNAPDGTWHCNDNWNNSPNPMVEITRGGTGQYDIWVGSRRPGATASGVLVVTESETARP